MRIKSLAYLLLACGLLALSACKSHDEVVAVEYDPASVPCTCGDPMTDMEGCACPMCISGEGNPGNPECVCGTIDLDQ